MRSRLATAIDIDADGIFIDVSVDLLRNHLLELNFFFFLSYGEFNDFNKKNPMKLRVLTTHLLRAQPIEITFKSLKNKEAVIIK